MKKQHHDAIDLERKDIVERLINEGVDVNDKKDGLTSLEFIVEQILKDIKPDERIVELLLKNGAFFDGNSFRKVVVAFSDKLYKKKDELDEVKSTYLPMIVLLFRYCKDNDTKAVVGDCSSYDTVLKIKKAYDDKYGIDAFTDRYGGKEYYRDDICEFFQLD